MKTFICTVCSQTSYSSAELENQIDPKCPYCRADKLVEVEKREHHRLF